MDFLNKAAAQVGDLFRSMTPGARITAGLLLSVVVISLVYLLNHQVRRGDAYLLGAERFSATELAAMEGAFGKAGLEGWEIDAGQVRVPSGQKAKFLAALVDAGAMPAHFGSHLTNAITHSSTFTPRSQQEALLKNALQMTLADVIRWLPGIERAAVLFETQKKQGRLRQPVTTAAVTVKPVGSQQLDVGQVAKIRDLVAGAINTEPEHVTVIDANGRHYPGRSRDGVGSAMDDQYFERMKLYQTQYEEKILAALSGVPGVTVTASVELDRETKHSEVRNHVDPKAVAIKTIEETSSGTSETGQPAGRPGMEAQQRPNTSAQLGASGKSAHTDEERTMSEVQNVTSTDQTTIELAPLTPKRVAVAVSVPRSYYEKVWREQNPTSAGQPPATPDKKALEQIELDEKTRIQNHVAALIPQPDATADNRPLVTVTSFTDIVEAEPPPPAATAQAVAWLLANWSTLGMAALGLFSLLMLRSIVRSGPALSDAPELLSPAGPAAGSKTEDAARPPEARAKPRLNRRASGPSLRTELVDIVREDPDAAANILRGWIGNPS